MRIKDVEEILDRAVLIYGGGGRDVCLPLHKQIFGHNVE